MREVDQAVKILKKKQSKRSMSRSFFSMKQLAMGIKVVEKHFYNGSSYMESYGRCNEKT